MVEEQDNIIKEEENEAVDDNNSLPAIMPSLLLIKIKLNQNHQKVILSEIYNSISTPTSCLSNHLCTD